MKESSDARIFVYYLNNGNGYCELPNFKGSSVIIPRRRILETLQRNHHSKLLLDLFDVCLHHIVLGISKVEVNIIDTLIPSTIFDGGRKTILIQFVIIVNWIMRDLNINMDDAKMLLETRVSRIYYKDGHLYVYTVLSERDLENEEAY